MVKKGIVLGHVISHDRVEVDKAKINLIANFSPPTYLKYIRSFLGHVRFYRRFIQYFNKIAKLLTNLLAKDISFHFFDECLKAFNRLKEVVTSAPILYSPVQQEPFELMCDASVRVVLGQCVDRKIMSSIMRVIL